MFRKGTIILESPHNNTCQHKIKDVHGMHYFGAGNNTVCGKTATHKTPNGRFLCRKHAHAGEFVVRTMIFPDGPDRGYVDGEILKRYDTIEQLRDGAKHYDNKKHLFQRIHGSTRRDISIDHGSTNKSPTEEGTRQF